MQAFVDYFFMGPAEQGHEDFTAHPTEPQSQESCVDMESLDIVAAVDLYPKLNFVSDDNITELTFESLSGEFGLYRGRTTEGIIIVTNYRLHHSQGTYINVPLALIEYLEARETILYIFCKDGKSFRCLFENTEDAMKWYKRINSENLEGCFAFRYLSYMRDEEKDHIVFQTQPKLKTLEQAASKPVEDDAFSMELARLGFDTDNHFRISKINENYKFCSSYPRYLVVPSVITDEELQLASNYRCSKRIPAIVWRHHRNGCVIARSSQPKMGIFNWWRCPEDEKLMETLFHVSLMNISEEAKEKKKLLIIDARSYTAAVTNRAKGGGYECEQYYPKCEIQYMGMANIHVVRTSFACLRALCATPEDPNWLSSLEKTMWLQHISGILRSALVVVDAVEVEERPVLVHCSDGWDRTPQIVSLAKLMLDPFYRTKKGFRVLVEREWLEFGHKFEDRCGHPGTTSAVTERCPVFLQWLDCVHQLHSQYPCHFEFNKQYLSRLALYTYSCLFGTFLHNTDAKRNEYNIRSRAYSVWPVLQNTNQFHNFLYNHSTEILRPLFHLRCLKFWSDVYLSNNSTKSPLHTHAAEENISPDDGSCSKKTNLVKTKSCDDILRADHSTSLQRRNSDPSIMDASLIEKKQVPLYPSLRSEEPPSLLLDTFLVNSCSGDAPYEDVIHIAVPSTSSQAVDSELKSDCSSNLERTVTNGSTDTLVNEWGPLPQQITEETRSKSTATDTSGLPLGTDDVLNIVRSSDNPELTEWYEHYLSSKRARSTSSTRSYDTPNQSHTPSSGFPATPSDDPGDMLNVETSSSRVMKCDGMEFAEDLVQEMLMKIILHYKNKCANLDREMRKARVELFEHMIDRQYQEKNNPDDPSVADSASSCDNRAESVNSESSWENICPDHSSGGSHSVF